MKIDKIILLAAVTIQLALPSYSYLCQPFNVNDLILKSDVVCKVRVTSLSRDGVYEISRFQPPPKVKKRIAQANVLSTLKGQVPETIRIQFPGRAETISFTALSRREITVVFLKRTDDYYEFTDILNGKMKCVPSTVKFEHGEAPEDKMLSELLTACNSSTGITRLTAVEQLGQLQDIRASQTLRDLSQSPDPVLRGVSLASRIQVSDSIKQNSLLEYLNLDNSLMDQGKSLAEYRTTAYQLTALKGQIMQALKNSIKVDYPDPWDITNSQLATLLEGFDYIAFYKKAYILPALTDSSTNRRSMAYALRLLADKRSFPLLMRMLDDPDSNVRYLAVTALTRIHGEGPFPSTPLFKSNEIEYIAYWKDKHVPTE